MPLFGRSVLTPAHFLTHPTEWIHFIAQMTEDELNEWELKIVAMLESVESLKNLTLHQRGSAWMLYTTIMYEHWSRHLKDRRPWEFPWQLDGTLRPMTDNPMLQPILRPDEEHVDPSWHEVTSHRNVHREFYWHQPDRPRLRTEPPVLPRVPSEQQSLSDFLPRYSELDRIVDIETTSESTTRNEERGEEGHTDLDNDHTAAYYAATATYSQWDLPRD